MKAFLNTFNRMGLHRSPGQYMLAAGCQFHIVDQFTKFMGIVVTVDWSYTPPPPKSCQLVTVRHYSQQFNPIKARSV
jgi:hypothetical protein